MVAQQHGHGRYGYQEMQNNSQQHMYPSIDDTYRRMDSNSGMVTMLIPSEPNTNHWQAHYEQQAWHDQPSGSSARSNELYSYHSDRHRSTGGSSSSGSSVLRSSHYDVQNQHAASGLVYAPYDPSALDPHMGPHQGRAPPTPPLQTHHPGPHLSVHHAYSYSAGDPSPPGSARSLGEYTALPHHMRSDGVEGHHSRATRSESWPGSFTNQQHSQDQDHHIYEEVGKLATSYAMSDSCPPQSRPKSTSPHEHWQYEKDQSPHTFAPSLWSSDLLATQHQRYPTQQMKSVHSSAQDDLVGGLAQRWQWNAQFDLHLQPQPQLQPHPQPQSQEQRYSMRGSSFRSGENQEEPTPPPVKEERTAPGGEQTKSRAWWTPNSSANDAASSTSDDRPDSFSGQLRKLKGKMKTRKAKGNMRLASEENEPRSEGEAESDGEIEGEGEGEGEGEEDEEESETISANDSDGKLRRRKISEASREYAQRRYRCEMCVGEPRMFARPSALRIHMLTHSKLKPHCCPECNRCFSIPSNLTRHRKLHLAPPHNRDEDGGVRNVRRSALEPHEVKCFLFSEQISTLQSTVLTTPMLYKCSQVDVSLYTPAPSLGEELCGEG
ncbi:BZ3500_MvSof-1268-A1-R1_Chr2-2g05024 [Microbotryum saponariae]|uniref:pH-response transcription factor pacC/RIM101 n=1 Tax=Microbotryum saponariae TaxID=289078 RepID=A0A2X0K8I7_9BASI|nr:BZ3500_MvSof-1268-A1-R1_Chr2-2g05024 [Microbotryum saponariae]SDA00728.1 BZ3501_MvSof-1269-A2-R1_Chr2-2g04698 [Microbotryum saponariae]